MQTLKKFQLLLRGIHKSLSPDPNLSLSPDPNLSQRHVLNIRFNNILSGVPQYTEYVGLSERPRFAVFTIDIPLCV
jgi:hypothetical protein